MNSDATSAPFGVQDRPDEPVWGSRQPWSRKQTLAVVGVAVVIAAFGGAAIYAATDGSSNATGPGWHGPGRGGPNRWNGPRGPQGPGRGVDDAGPPDSLHGEFVVSDGNGGYTTMLTQTGVLTAVSDTSITAKSADGFTQTYTITPGSRAANSQLAVDDTANILATVANGTATATTVTKGDDAGPGDPPPFGSP